MTTVALNEAELGEVRAILAAHLPVGLLIDQKAVPLPG